MDARISRIGAAIVAGTIAASLPQASNATHDRSFCEGRRSMEPTYECTSTTPASGIELRYVVRTLNPWEIRAARIVDEETVSVVLASGPSFQQIATGIMRPMTGDILTGIAYRIEPCPASVPTQACVPDAAFVWSDLPAVGRTNEVRDGDDCNRSSESFIDANPDAAVTDQDNADRGAVCLRANGTTAFYLGGELQAEDPDNQGKAGGGMTSYEHGACGAVIIAGSTYGSGHKNRNNDPTKSQADRDADWSFVHRHPGPDGILFTEDDEFHPHDCN